MSLLPPAAQRVEDEAKRLGLPIVVRVMPASTRTAAEAAAACGCSVGQIVKSLVFVGLDSGRPVLLLVSGANRVDEAGVAATLGEPLNRPEAAAVRSWTGFAIGGIPPFAHTTPLPTFIDEDLLRFDAVWAAAGTPSTVFRVDPTALARAVGARTLTVA